MTVNTDNVIFSSLGACIEFNKPEFVELLKESGVSADNSFSTEQLIDVYLNNVRTNPALMLGSAYFIAYHTTDIAFDGQKSVDNNTVHSIGRSMFSYFDMANADEDYSNVDWGNVWSGVKNVAGGLKQGGIAGGIGAATESIGTAVDRRQNPQNYTAKRQPLSSAGVDLLQQKQQARNQMIQSALAAQKAKADAAAKVAEEQRKKKTITYVAVGVGAVVVIGLGLFLYFRSQKNK